MRKTVFYLSAVVVGVLCAVNVAYPLPAWMALGVVCAFVGGLTFSRAG